MDSWRRTGDDGDTLVREKELLPEGDVVKWVGNDKEVMHIRAKRKFLEQIVDQFKKFKEVGVKVPLFKTHKEDPDNERGKIEDVYIKPNSKGVQSLHIKAKFGSKKALRQGIKNDVSAGMPTKFVDGKGNSYSYPLRHVALTSFPVVPGLDDWSGPIVLSFDTPSGLLLSNDDDDDGDDDDTKVEDGDNMGIIDEILTELEVEAPTGADENAKLSLILNAVKTDDDAPEPKPKPKVTTGALNLSYPPVLLKQFKDARVSTIENLAEQSVITPAIKDKWIQRYCSADALKVDLSLDTESGETEFDRMVEQAKLIAESRPLSSSGRKTIKLSHGDDKDNPLIADAKRRAERAKAQTA